MKKIWLKNYPEGVNDSVKLNEFQSFVEFIEKTFKKYPDSIAFENMGNSVKYNELDILSKNFSLYLTEELKLEKGDRLAIQSSNILQFPIALFAALRCGIIVVNTNPLYTPSEMSYQFKDSGCKAILILSNFVHNLEKIISETKIKHIIITDIGDNLDYSNKSMISFDVKYAKKIESKFSVSSVISFKEALFIGNKYKFKKHHISSKDLAFLQYTGGTTGVSKGAMLTNYNVLSNICQVSLFIDNALEDGKEVVITALPLYHIFALVINTLVMFKYGVKNILITNPRDMDGFVEELSKHNFSIISGVNTLYNGLLNNKNFKNLNFSNLKVSFGGGMSTQKEVAIKWNQVTGCALFDGYGLTEASPVVALSPINEFNKIGFVGLPIPNTEIKFIDEKNHEVEIGERGEICVRGPQVMKGYWRRESATNEIIDKGWLKTGDIGLIDNDGFIKIVDRKKEMILVSGFNVYPNEIEDEISSHPKVLEVGVIGVPDKKSIESVKAVIVKKNQSLSFDEIKLHCKKKLTNYKCPKHFSFVDKLPKSNVGKILRRVIKEKDLKENKY